MQSLFTGLAVLIGIAILFGLGHWATRRATKLGQISELRKQLWYQPTALVTICVLAFLLTAVTPRGRDLGILGNLDSSSSAMAWLGFPPGTSWLEVGPTLVLFPFLATVAVVYLQVIHKKAVGWNKLPVAILASIPISLTNSLTEEILFRYMPIRGFSGLLSPVFLALVCAAAFGLPHYFGKPGKIPGVVMAGFLGYLMAWSVIDSGNLQWAWMIHFAQDVPIIAMLLLV